MRNFRYAVLIIFFLPVITLAQVIQSHTAVVLPVTSGSTMVISSGQTLSVTSNTSITLNPGFSALAGSNASFTIVTSSIYPTPLANNNTNPELNWVINRSFDENGNIIAASKNFFDLSGKMLQSQVMSMSTGHVLATQTLDDRYGRLAIQSLSAPINSSDFYYKSDFITDNGVGQRYNTSQWDLPTNLNNPNPVGAVTPGTLGWYYSNNNTWDAYVPATAYPYSRTDFFKDGTDAPSNQAGVGEQLKMGMGHETVGNSIPVISELSNYLAIRNRFFTDPGSMGITGQTDLLGSAVQTVGKDAQGNWVMSISDKDGKTLMTALPGSWLTVNNTVDLRNYKEEFDINGSTLNQQLTALKLDGAGWFKIFNNNTLVYQGLLGAYTVPGIINTTDNYKFLSDKSFTVQYSAITGTNTQAPVCENCHSQIQTGNVNGQDYHYFALPQGGTITVSGGQADIEDVISNTVTLPYLNGPLTLPAGMYKAKAQTGQPQLSYSTSWGDISYNFFDQKGQGVAAITPNGVQQIITNGVNAYADLAHLPFTSTVEYNKKGQVMASNSTDGGRSEFVYRMDGKIRFSQNAEQRTTGRFSYTNYDDSGRPTESGEYVPGDVSFAAAKTNTALLENTNQDGGLTGGTKQDWVRTHYDLADNSHGQSGYVQDYLDGAVSWTENVNAKTWYSYDEQGKITWIVKFINGLGYKAIDYTYDYLGNVTTIAYQKNNPNESFYHHYTYDADKRLANVATSRDGINKLQQANYQYYLHGPLKRIELAEQLQGIDYVYTAQGVLKSINHAGGDPVKDPGHDGQNNFAPDAFGMQLEYFNGDYTRSGTNISSVNTGTNYFNGNVSALGWQSQKPVGSSGLQNPSMYNYGYDNKSQLTNATWGAPNYDNNVMSFTPQTKFSEKNITYDPNGNIQGLQRTNSGGSLSDDFSSYQYQSGTNQLNSVGNASNPNSYASYTYDNLGRLKSMQRTGEAFAYYLKYDVTGKIMGIYADAALTQLKIGYGYDEMGHRISRTDNTTGTLATSYYEYDLAGNNLAIYNGTALAETPFYGSGRIGTYTFANNGYVYELRDNVGSVRVVINRNKNGNGQADIATYNDYYPFGSTAQSGGIGYHYDYQGTYAEKDPVTGFNNFELRMYDGRVGRWLSVDPDRQFASPYEGMGNNPVNGIDPNGADWVKDSNGVLQWRADVTGADDMEWFNNVHAIENPDDFLTFTYAGKTTIGSFANGGQWYGDENGNKSGLLSEVNIRDVYTGPAATVNSISWGFAFGGGFGFELGRIEDWHGNSRWFWSASANIGFGAGIGLNHRQIKNNPGQRFKLDDYQGTSSSYTAGFGPISGSYGGNESNWETDTFNPFKLGTTYTESGGAADPKLLLTPKAVLRTPLKENLPTIMWSHTKTVFF